MQQKHPKTYQSLSTTISDDNFEGSESESEKIEGRDTNIQQEIFIRFNHSKTKDLNLPEDLDFYDDPEDIIKEFDDKKIQDELTLSDSDHDESFNSEKKMTN